MEERPAEEGPAEGGSVREMKSAGARSTEAIHEGKVDPPESQRLRLSIH